MTCPLNAVLWAWLLLEECNNPLLRPERPPQNFCETEKGKRRRKREEEVGGKRGDEGEWGRGRGSGWKKVEGERREEKEGQEEGK